MKQLVIRKLKLLENYRAYFIVFLTYTVEPCFLHIMYKFDQITRYISLCEVEVQ